MAVNFKDLTDEQLEAWDPNYKGKGRGKRRTGKRGSGPVNKAWDKYSTRKTQQFKSVVKSVKDTTKKGVELGSKTIQNIKDLHASGADFRGGNRNWIWTGNREGRVVRSGLTTQQKQRLSLQKSMKQLQEDKLAHRAEIARRSKLTPNQQQSEKNQRILNQVNATRVKNDDGSTPSSENTSVDSRVTVTPDTAPGSKKNWFIDKITDDQGLSSFWSNKSKANVNTKIPELVPKVNIEDLTDREHFALGQVRGSVAKNKARAKEIRIEQQRERLGKNIQGGPQVGGNTAGEKFTQTQNNLVNNKEFSKNWEAGSDIFKKPAGDFDPSSGFKKGDLTGKDLLGDKKASLPKKTEIKKLAQNLGIETRPWKLILNAVMALGNPNMGDKQLPFDNKMGQIAANLAREGTEGIPQDPDPYSWA